MKQIRELFFNFADNAINTYKGSISEGAEVQGKAASAKVSHSISINLEGHSDNEKANKSKEKNNAIENQKKNRKRF